MEDILDHSYHLPDWLVHSKALVQFSCYCDIFVISLPFSVFFTINCEQGSCIGLGGSSNANIQKQLRLRHMMRAIARARLCTRLKH